MIEPLYEVIARMVVNSRMTVVLTGAGISTESGIPDFRTPGSGLWEKVDPMEALSASVLYDNPVKFYSTGFSLLTSMKHAMPNKAHLLLSRMENENLIQGIITQNIDNLHFQAGSKNILEVHGHIRSGHCIKCGVSYEFSMIEDKVDKGEIPPLCNCSGMIRPDVVLFGDNLPDCFNTAWELAKKSDLMIIIGSSLQVSPVNCLPGFAKKLIIINSSETQYDKKADVVLRDKASNALINIYDKIREIKLNG